MIPKKVVVAGHICIDITPTVSSDHSGKMEDILSPGKLVTVGGADIHTGGAVANTGLAMKLLGADVSLAGKIGDDSFGGMVESIVREYGAEDGLIKRKGESTSYTIVIAVPGVDRIFLHHPGANDTFCADDLPDGSLKEAALLHFGYPPIMKRMYENNGDELVRIFDKAGKAGAATSLDLAAVDPNSDSGKADWEKILSRTLPLVDFFVPSAEELMYMLDRDMYRRVCEEAGKQDITGVLQPERDIMPLAERCIGMGARVVLIKCGALGMYYRTAGEDEIRKISGRLELDTGSWADRSGFEESYVPEKILSGTGAGDTSVAAFLTAMLNGFPPDKCIRYAAATGACCVAAYDALSGLLPFEELDKRIAAGWKKATE